MRIGWDMEIHAGPHVQAAALEMGGEHPDKQVAPGSGSGQVRGDVDRGKSAPGGTEASLSRVGEW